MIYSFISPVSATNFALFDFPYKKITKLIANKAVEKNKVKIAVLTYQSMDDQKSIMGGIISEQIIVELVNSNNLNIVERSQVEKLLQELQFNQTGAIDAATAKKIGNGLGADALVIGSFTMVGDSQLMLFTKLVDTETFQVLGASQDLVNKKTITSSGINRITYGGMIWRTLVVPGWGHLYADQWRGWIYIPLWAGSLGSFIFGLIDYNTKSLAYFTATSNLENAYTEYNNTRKFRNISFIAILGVYTISIGDILITGNGYMTPSQTSSKSAIPSTVFVTLSPNFDGILAEVQKKW